MITIYLKQYNKIIRNAEPDLLDTLGYDDILWIDPQNVVIAQGVEQIGFGVADYLVVLLEIDGDHGCIVLRVELLAGWRARNTPRREFPSPAAVTLFSPDWIGALSSGPRSRIFAAPHASRR